MKKDIKILSQSGENFVAEPSVFFFYKNDRFSLVNGKVLIIGRPRTKKMKMSDSGISETKISQNCFV